MKVVIIKYNAGNVRSVIFALERLGISPLLTDDPDEIIDADKVIFPGVGEASSTMRYLKQSGLDKIIISLKQPVLGICLGMQLMCSYSEEGDTECLKIFNQKVLKFKNPDSEKFKIPHIGWNNIFNYKSTIFNNITEHEFVYFVHSYYVETGEYTVACSDYIHKFSAAIQKDNFFAVQFHPEKSGKVGEQIIKNFILVSG